MALVTGPLLSMSASGSVGKAITFSNAKGAPVARGYKVPSNPNTAAQQAQRAFMAYAVAAWKALSSDAKTAFNLRASLLNPRNSGANVFTRTNIVEQKAETDPYAVQSFTATPGDGSLALAIALMNTKTLGAITSAEDIYAVLGTSPTNLGEATLLTWNAGSSKFTGTITGLTNDQAYYVSFYRGTADRPVAGLYRATPAA